MSCISENVLANNHGLPIPSLNQCFFALRQLFPARFVLHLLSFSKFRNLVEIVQLFELESQDCHSVGDEIAGNHSGHDHGEKQFVNQHGWVYKCDFILMRRQCNILSRYRKQGAVWVGSERYVYLNHLVIVRVVGVPLISFSFGAQNGVQDGQVCVDEAEDHNFHGQGAFTVFEKLVVF